MDMLKYMFLPLPVFFYNMSTFGFFSHPKKSKLFERHGMRVGCEAKL